MRITATEIRHEFAKTNRRSLKLVQLKLRTMEEHYLISMQEWEKARKLIALNAQKEH